MQSITRLWSSGCLGKIVIMVAVAIAGSCACGALATGFGALLPDEFQTTAPSDASPSEPDMSVAPGVEPTGPEAIEPTQVEPNEADLAVFIVSTNLEENKLGITEDQLLSMENSKGSGVFVYVPETRYSGVERFILWLVLDGTAYPLNGATKGITPHLPWPREAPEEVWSQSQLDTFQATEAIEIVFGE